MRGREGEKEEKDEAKGNVVADLENLVHNKRLSRGLADLRRLERLKAKYSDLNYRTIQQERY